MRVGISFASKPPVECQHSNEYIKIPTGSKLLSASPRNDHKGQCHCLCQCHHVLQGLCQYQNHADDAISIKHQHQALGGGPGEGRDQCGRLQWLCSGSCCYHIEESLVILMVVVYWWWRGVADQSRKWKLRNYTGVVVVVWVKLDCVFALLYMDRIVKVFCPFFRNVLGTRSLGEILSDRVTSPL